MSLPELAEAAAAADAALLRELLGKLVPAERAEWLRDAVIRAVYECREDTLQALLEVGASVNVADALGHTPLHWTARQGHQAIARLLIQQRAAVDAVSQDGSTPLHLAATYNSAPVAQLLLKSRADQRAASSDGRTALHFAADHGSSAVMSVLLDARPRLRSNGSPYSSRPTTVASQIGSSPGPAEEEQEEVSVLELETDRGESALARAAVRGHAAVAQLLLAAQADFTHTNCWGQTPLQLAARSGQTAPCAVLLEAKAEIDVAAQDGSTALHTAAERGSSEVVELLLSHAANAEMRSTGGRAPLHAAAERGSSEAAMALLRGGASTETQTSEGRTALSFAAGRGHVGVLQVLLQMQAKLQAKDSLRQTALHAAAAAGRPEAAKAAELLLQASAVVDPQDASGRTPFVLAVGTREEKTIRVLLRYGAQPPEDVVREDAALQGITREVERELLDATLEGNSRSSQEQLREAERKFEEAREALLKAAALGVAQRYGPVVRHLEGQLALLKENVSATSQGEVHDKEKIAATQAELKVARAHNEGLTTKLERKLKDIEDLKMHHYNLTRQLQALKGEVDEARVVLRKSRGTGHENDKIMETTEEARREVREIRAELQEVERDEEVTRAELQKVLSALTRWDETKDAVASVHAKAAARLQRKNAVLDSSGRPRPATSAM